MIDPSKIVCKCGHERQEHREKREGLAREICLEEDCSCLQFVDPRSFIRKCWEDSDDEIWFP